MRNLFFATIERSTYVTSFLLLLLFFETCTPAFGQQHVIANKDRTRPDINEQLYRPALITGMGIKRLNGYNEVTWTALREYDTRKYVVEYSMNGIDFTVAGEVTANTGFYTFNHQFLDDHMFDDPAILYRIRIEQMNNTAYYSDPVLLEGDGFSPVKIFPTIIQGNQLNIQAQWPVEKIDITNTSGQLLLSKNVNGQKDYMTLTVPTFSKGMYLITFYGQYWKTTSKFIVP